MKKSTFNDSVETKKLPTQISGFAIIIYAYLGTCRLPSVSILISSEEVVAAGPTCPASFQLPRRVPSSYFMTHRGTVPGKNT
jgi:hypothetical protein